MTQVENLIRPHLKELQPYSSAREEFAGEEGIFLDANENPYGKFNRYPDPYQTKLKEKIGQLKGISSKKICLGNGSDEIIDLLLKVFCEPRADDIVVFKPTFGMYETLARINDVKVVKLNLDKSFQIDVDDVKLEKLIQFDSAKMAFICSPNNPVGNSINREAIEYLLSTFKGVIAIDEAYIDFSSSESWLPMIENYPNLIVLQTLSKAWGLAGVRIGMAFAAPEIIAYLNKVKPPYNISSANQKLALERLDHKRQYQKQIGKIVSERKRVANVLASCETVKKIYPSEANFILVEVKNADEVYESLLKEKIIVRNRHKLIKNALRVTIGTPEENDLLIAAFKNIAK